MSTVTPAPSRPGLAQAAQRDREGGEAEIGLGLAAAGREEQQVDDLAVRMRRIGQAGEVEQDEGELERPPDRRLLRGGDRRRGRRCDGVPPPRSRGSSAGKRCVHWRRA